MRCGASIRRAQASKTYVNRDGVQMWGPSGAVVWNAPTIDAKRGALYFGTGQNSSSPATDTSDSIIALDLKTGEKRWVFQALADDAWNAACLSGGASCPKENGPDFDFGASVMLVRRDKGDLLLAGQKSGEVFALDPDKGGAVVWRRRVGSGSSNGGVHHGMATDGERVYVPVADPERKIQGYVPKPGVYALSVDHRRSALVAAGAARLRRSTRKTHRWSASPRWRRASRSALRGRRAATTTVSPRLRFTRTGWSMPARSTASCACSTPQPASRCASSRPNSPFAATNGVEGHGGAIDVGGAIVDGDQLFITSGYGMFGQMPGNMLLVYGLKR